MPKDGAHAPRLTRATPHTRHASHALLVERAEPLAACSPLSPRRAPRACVCVCVPLDACVSQGALVDKWNAARAEAHLEERLDAQQAAEPSLELLEERKRKRVAEWRDGLSQEDAERGINFTPLAADWRQRVKQRKQLGAEKK